MNQEMLAFLIYKIASLACGVLSIYWGYKLFVRGIFSHAADMDVAVSKHKMTLKKAAPGTFFSLFGAIIISVTIMKGFSWENRGLPDFQSPNTYSSINFDSTSYTNRPIDSTTSDIGQMPGNLLNVAKEQASDGTSMGAIKALINISKVRGMKMANNRCSIPEVQMIEFENSLIKDLQTRMNRLERGGNISAYKP